MVAVSVILGAFKFVFLPWQRDIGCRRAALTNNGADAPFAIDAATLQSDMADKRPDDQEKQKLKRIRNILYELVLSKLTHRNLVPGKARYTEVRDAYNSMYGDEEFIQECFDQLRKQVDKNMTDTEADTYMKRCKDNNFKRLRYNCVKKKAQGGEEDGKGPEDQAMNNSSGSLASPLIMNRASNDDEATSSANPKVT